MLIRNAEVKGEVVDVRLDHGVVAEIGVRLTIDGPSFDAQGCALIPGLHDHHIHLNATAAAMNSVRCGPPEVETRAALIAALQQAGGAGWLRGVGYHDSVAGEIDRDWLDRHGPDRPVRIQHRSGRLWILNSRAMDALGITEPDNGRVLDADHSLRLGAGFPDLNPLIKRLLSYGITGVTEVTPSNGRAELEHYLKNAQPLRMAIMGGAELSGHDAPNVGPLKLHYHDHDLPALDSLADEITAAHAAGRTVASHCVTRAELMLTLAAIEQAGPRTGDRIEHAAIADEFAVSWMARLGVIVVTQPNFITERVAAYRTDVPPEDHPHLWRLKTFIDAGLPVAAGSDAPFGDPNPWAAMDAAVRRPAGFEAEAVSPETALALYTKPTHDAGALPRDITVGAWADLCLLDRSWGVARENLASVGVQATWIGGQCVYSTMASIKPQSSAV